MHYPNIKLPNFHVYVDVWYQPRCLFLLYVRLNNPALNRCRLPHHLPSSKNLPHQINQQISKNLQTLRNYRALTYRQPNSQVLSAYLPVPLRLVPLYAHTDHSQTCRGYHLGLGHPNDRPHEPLFKLFLHDHDVWYICFHKASPLNPARSGETHRRDIYRR